MSAADLASRLELAYSAARMAGEITLRYFQQGNYEVELKHDSSPVTVADREAEQYLRSRIEAAFPDDGILGEELPERLGTSGYRWILDPIDGTKSFISGVPLYATLVGVEHEGRSVVGALRIPRLEECVFGAIGLGAWYVRGKEAPQPTRVSSVRRLADSLFCTSEVRTFAQVRREAAYRRLQDAARLTRTWGDAYGYLLVATGRAEVMVDPKLKIWDCAALQPILEEAGGTFTDWQGRSTIHASEGIATNGHVLEEVLGITRGPVREPTSALSLSRDAAAIT